MFAILRWFATHPRVLVFLGLLILFAMVPTWVYLAAMGLVVARFVYLRWRRRRRASVESGKARRVRRPAARPLERRKQEGRLRHVS